MCETSLNDVMHCGGCMKVCDAQHASVACENETCQVTACAAGYDDCDKSGDNGCETSLSANDNCGSCKRDCTIDGATCSMGLCGTVQLFGDTDMPFGTDNSGARSWAFDPTTASAFWAGFGNYSVRRYAFDGSGTSLVWQPTTPAAAGLESVAVTGGNVYWSVGGSPATVFQKAIGAASSVTPTQAFHPAARASFMRVQGNSFYWATGDYQDPSAPATGQIFTRLISAPATDPGTAIVTADQGNFSDFKSFQTSADALYWVTDKGTVPFELRTTPLTGGTPSAVPMIAGATSTAITDSNGAIYTPTPIVAVGSTIYFTRFIATSAINGIYRYTPGDATPTQIVSADGVKSVLVDSNYIYYIINNDQHVFKAAVAGGTSPVAIAIGGPAAYKLIGQDATYLYLLQSASGSSTLAKIIK